MGPERIGVFGGTFDPPHFGHLVVATHVRAALGLDRVLLVVANEPWQKVGTRPISPARVRLDLVAAAVGDTVGLEVSDLEVRRGGASFTIDTVDELSTQGPDRQLFVIVGADVDLETWDRIDEVSDRSTLVRVDRGGLSDASVDAAASGGRIDHVVHVPRIDVSSSDLRRRFELDLPVDFLLPSGVVDLIRRRRLYRGGS